MTTRTKKSTPQYADKVAQEPTEATANLVTWLEAETGYKVDPVTVKLTRLLGGKFQQSDANQARMAERREERAAEAKAKADRKSAAKAPAPAKKAEPKPARAKKPATTRRRKPAAKKEAAIA